MAINIQKIFDITQQKLFEADSSAGITELGRFAILSRTLRRMQNGIVYADSDDFPISNQGTEGRIVQNNTNKTWYLSHKFQWKEIELDSDEAV